MELIDKDTLVAEIRKRLLPVIRDKHYDEFEEGQNSERIAILDIINTIEVKEVADVRFPHEKNIVDKVFGAGNLEYWEYNEAKALVALAKEELLKDLESKEVDQIELLLHSFLERIRKRIIHALHGDVLDMEETNKAIAWIEKQGEQKSIWHNEDEEELGIAIDYLQRAGQWDSATWLKSLKTRIVDIEHERYYKNDI